MKIRTDFVTNSSSSSYCVSLSVTPTESNKKIVLDLWPDGEDGSGSVNIGMRVELDEFIGQVKACSSVDELKSLLVNLLDFSNDYYELFGELSVPYSDTNEEILQTLAAISEEDDKYIFLSGITKPFNDFKDAFNSFSSLNEIKSITVKEYFTGWGEFAGEGIEGFLNTAIPEELDLYDEEAVKEALIGKLNEDEIETLINGSCSDFSAYISTTIDLSTGEVTKKYSFDGS